MSIQKNSFYVFVAELVHTTYSSLVKIPVYQSFFFVWCRVVLFFMITAKMGAPTSFFFLLGVPITRLTNKNPRTPRPTDFRPGPRKGPIENYHPPGDP